MRVCPPPLFTGNLQGLWRLGLARAANTRVSPRPSCAGVATHATGTNGGMVENGSRLQDLYTLARTTFSGQRIPSKPEISKVLEAMCAVPLEDLGLSPPSLDSNRGDWRFPDRKQDAGLEGTGGAITYLPVKEEDDLHVGIFCLPANAEIPLHDHPGMTVLSRLLYGKMHVRAYDWISEDGDTGQYPVTHGFAKLVMDGVLSGESGATSVLFPNWANVHSFKALTPCAVLDILSPPYEPEDGRDCTYFRELLPSQATPSQPQVDAAREDFGENIPLTELQECEPPEDFIVRRGMYGGFNVEGWEE